MKFDQAVNEANKQLGRSWLSASVVDFNEEYGYKTTTTTHSDSNTDFSIHIDLVEYQGEVDVTITIADGMTNGITLRASEKSIKFCVAAFKAADFDALPELLRPEVYALGMPPRQGVKYKSICELHKIVEGIE